jgi:hypothetical protein
VTQLFRLNTTISEGSGLTPTPVQPGTIRLRQVGKPLGATFLGISILVLIVGGRRYFESQVCFSPEPRLGVSWIMTYIAHVGGFFGEDSADERLHSTGLSEANSLPVEAASVSSPLSPLPLLLRVLLLFVQLIRRNFRVMNERRIRLCEEALELIIRKNIRTCYKNESSEEL